MVERNGRGRFETVLEVFFFVRSLIPSSPVTETDIRKDVSPDLPPTSSVAKRLKTVTIAAEKRELCRLDRPGGSEKKKKKEQTQNWKQSANLSGFIDWEQTTTIHDETKPFFPSGLNDWRRQHNQISCVQSLSCFGKKNEARRQRTPYLSRPAHRGHCQEPTQTPAWVTELRRKAVWVYFTKKCILYCHGQFGCASI